VWCRKGWGRPVVPQEESQEESCEVVPPAGAGRANRGPMLV
jgi:hypothetical protein